jgi:hypothetical protein
MGLPTSGQISVSAIKTEFNITTLQQSLSNDLGPTIGITAGATTNMSSFWGKSSGNYIQGAAIIGSGTVSMNWITTDSDGNIYACGSYVGAPTIYNLTAAPNATSSGVTLPTATTYSMPFLIKWNRSGVYQFSTALVAGTLNVSGNGIDVDTAGNIYFCGSYSGTPTIYNLTSSPNTSSSGRTLNAPNLAGRNKCFLIKWNSSGTYQYSTAFYNGNYDSGGNFVKTDSANNVYMSLNYYGAPTIWNLTASPSTSTTTYTLVNDPTGYTWGAVVKWNSSGTYVSCMCLAGQGSYGLTGPGRIFFDSSDSLYLCMSIRSAGVVLYNFAAVPNSSSSGQSLPSNTSTSFVWALAKWNSSGTYQWAGSETGTTYGGGQSIQVDSSGNVYFSGAYSNGAQLIYNLTAAPCTVSSGQTLPSSLGFSWPFLIKWNSAGTYQYSVVSKSNGDGILLAIDKNNNVYWGGNRQGAAATIYNMSANPNTSATAYSYPNTGTQYWGFLSKFNSSGTYLYSTSYNTAGAYNSYCRAGVVSLGNLFTCGYYQANPTLYHLTANPNTVSSGQTLPNSTAFQNGYVLKLTS